MLKPTSYGENPVLRVFLTAAAAIAISLTIAIGLTARSEATSVVRFDFDSLCDHAPTIAHVRVTGSEMVATEDRVGVRTRTTFEILETVKGKSGTVLVITLPGGRLDDRHVTVAGMPVFEVGQETVVFLSEPDPDGSPWPVGLSQGCYRVLEGSEVELQRGSTPIPTGAAFKPVDHRPYRVPLSTFLEKIRETTPAH